MTLKERYIYQLFSGEIVDLTDETFTIKVTSEFGQDFQRDTSSIIKLNRYPKSILSIGDKVHVTLGVMKEFDDERPKFTRG